jgi:hypothetical protein
MAIEVDSRRKSLMETQKPESNRRRLSTKDMAAATEHEDERVREERAAEQRHDTDRRRMGQRDGGAAAGAGNDEEPSPLLSGQQTDEFRSRWNTIQTSFVDEPRKTVEQADELVAEIMQRLAQSFSDQRSNLERQWEHAEEVSTEDLRLALRRYRSFFDRLLAL